jgi:hypothetical protein
LKKLLKGLFSINVLLILNTLLVQQNLYAQEYEIGGGFGVAGYTGDIIRIGDPRQLGFQGTLLGRQNFDNVWSLRGGLSFAGLKGSDLVNPIDDIHLARGASFNGTALEASVVMEYHFIDYLQKNSEFKFSPYAFFGVGALKFVGKGDSYSEDIRANRDININTVVIPFGVGMKYKLSDQWILALELGYRGTFTDGIDKIKSSNPDTNLNNVIPTVFPPGYNLHKGNVYDNDGYYFMGLTISYKIRNLKCLIYN